MSIFDVGDRVRYWLNYRAKGIYARPGGWQRVWGRGTVKQVNRVTVDVLPDGRADVTNHWRRLPMDRVEYLEEERDYS